MFGMLSVLGELRRELIVANTRDGLAAVRARGRRGGRPTRLTPDQVQLAQRLYDAGEPTDAQIADTLTVPRSTIYGHLDKAAVGARPRAQKAVTPPSPPSARTHASEPNVPNMPELWTRSDHPRGSHHAACRPGRHLAQRRP